jgi:phosphoadenosine phosphosulfate reductase
LEKAGYLAHAGLPAFRRRISASLALVEQAGQVMRRPYISMSFGKDSTVMTHLLLTVLPDAPVIYIDCGTFDEWPDTPRVKTEFLARYPCRLIEITGSSIIDYYRQAGIAYTQEAEETPAARRAQRAYGASLGRLIAQEAQRLNCDGGFIGMRRESANRQRLFNQCGPLYFAQERQLWTCCPLAAWSARDVWAYIVQHDLPYNELYDIHPRGRELARNGAMLGTRLAGQGRLAWLKQMYPAWWNLFVAEFPEIARQL